MFVRVDRDQDAFLTRLFLNRSFQLHAFALFIGLPSPETLSLFSRLYRTMETSPPPTPRRTVRRDHSRQSTTPIRRIAPRASSSKPVSRFATPARGAERLSSVADEEEAGSNMDVDGANELMDRILKSETVFAKSSELQVTFYSHLPTEVKQVLRNAGTRTIYLKS